MTIENAIMQYKIAKLYYIDHMSQQEISEKLSISRPQISRLLKKAQENGIVDIQVHFPNKLTRDQVAERLEKIFDGRSFFLTSSSDTEEERIENMCIGAARYLTELLEPYKVIGVGFGMIPYKISQRLPFQAPVDGRTIVALSGESYSNNPYLQTNTIVDRFAERYRASAFYNHFPSQFDSDLLSPSERKRLNMLQRNWDRLEIAVVSIGSLSFVQQNYSDEFEYEDFYEEVSRTMKADILGNFFSKDKEYHFPDSRRTASIPLEQLVNIPNVICISGGEQKIDAIILGLEKNYYNTLITDEGTARKLLEKCEAQRI